MRICCRRSSAARPGRPRCAPGSRRLPRASPTIVLVHDAARPFAQRALVARAIDAAQATGAAVPGLPVTDTVKTRRCRGPCRADARPRPRCALIQTPQAFAFAPLLDAHRRAAAQGRDDFTDDAALAEWAGMTVVGVRRRARQHQDHHRGGFRPRRGHAQFASAGRRAHRHRHRRACFRRPAITSCSAACASRTTQALIGHSDADVVLHALTDAILGALADGDIGAHFPPSDPQWRGASSDRFLAFAVERVRGARRPHRASRHHRGLRGAQDRPASRRHARSASPRSPASARARGGEGDDQREARLHRPRRRHRRLRHRNGAAAVELTRDARRRNRRRRRKRCSTCARRRS